MVNCQLPDRLAGSCELLLLELPPPPQDDSVIAPANNQSNAHFALRVQNSHFRLSEFFRQGVGLFVRICMICRVLETQLQAKLNRARAMCIERVQERCPSYAVGSAAFKSRGI